MYACRICLPLLYAAACAAFGGSLNAAETTLVENGSPRAEIVIAQNSPRLVKLAAEELQTYIAKITGATLPIVTKPTGEWQTAIYVGKSAHTDTLLGGALKLTDAGLKHGAFRFVVGDRFVVLLGRDADFTPRAPWARDYAGTPKMLAEWDKLTGEKWGNHYGASLMRGYNKQMKLWDADQGGSLQAVYELLRRLGVRWYMPGELGEIVPKQTTIKLATTDETIRPDFAQREFHFAFYWGALREDLLWTLRLGLNHGETVRGHGEPGHGMSAVTTRPETKQAHPEYYALWNGKRATAHYGGAQCLSSPGLFEQNVKYVRAMFDIYDEPMVSVMPEDGYSNACECELCNGKEQPSRGFSGKISDYVWDYVNRVAIEVNKTHPHKRVNCFAYGTYTQPPSHIEKLSPNLVVGIVQPRRMFNDPAKRKEFVDLRQAWLKKFTAPDPFTIWEHYPFTAPGRPSYGLPLYFPQLIAEDLKSLKGISQGEIIEVMFDEKKSYGLHAPAFNHLNLYVTSRFYWNADQDIDALLADYYRDFYGPAAGEMQAFIEYCEAEWRNFSKSGEKIGRMLALISRAQAKAESGTPYRQRIDLLVEYLKPMKELQEQLAKGRGDVPAARATKLHGVKFTIDGKLDEPVWKNVATYGLSEIETGRPATFKTSFRTCWVDGHLYFGITCADRDVNALNIATTKDEDHRIWNGDCIEILMETQLHSYYQLAINPAGAKIDLDRAGGINDAWASEAVVAAHIGDGFWSVEVKIPMAGDGNSAAIDPLHGVSGREPTQMYPWYFNICRQRVRENGSELSAFSPTSKSDFHVLRKFGSLYAW